MMLRAFATAFSLLAIGTVSAGAQSSAPGSNPPVPQARTQSDIYVPLYGGSLGISIPLGRLSDDHAAGYGLGAMIEYAVTGQPYSLRGEVLVQHFPQKTDRTVGDVNVFTLGPTIVYRLQRAVTQPCVTAGIELSHASREGTRPGFNTGGGVEIPLTGFAAIAEARIHVMLADSKPILTLPLSVGLRF